MKFVFSIAVVAFLATGCVFSHKQVATQGATGAWTTNTVTTVNEANLALDSAGLQAATAVAVNVAIVQTRHDPNVLSALKNAKVALDGILTGTNPATTQQVIDMLRANGNPALVTQVQSIVQTLSALEQKLLVQYGASVAGEISLAILKAVDAGLTTGLAGQ